MMKVYLVVECAGEYEDYREWIAEARFDENKAKQIREKLIETAANNEKRLTELEKEHDYYECNKENCQICKEIEDIEWIVRDKPYYRIDQIEVK